MNEAEIRTRLDACLVPETQFRPQAWETILSIPRERIEAGMMLAQSAVLDGT